MYDTRSRRTVQPLRDPAFDATGEAVAPRTALQDNRPESAELRETISVIGQSERVAAQRQTIDLIRNSPRVNASPFAAAQRAVDKPPRNDTGLPDGLKSGIERLSGVSIDEVRVHYGSNAAAQLGAFAYAQGNQIHVAPGKTLAARGVARGAAEAGARQAHASACGRDARER